MGDIITQLRDSLTGNPGKGSHGGGMVASSH